MREATKSYDFYTHYPTQYATKKCKNYFSI